MSKGGGYKNLTVQITGELNIFAAIRWTQLNRIKTLISSGQCSPNCHDDEGVPVLILCVTTVLFCYKGASTGEIHDDMARSELLETFLQLGADVNIVDDKGLTAVMYAASRGLTLCVKVLVKYGVNLNVTNELGTTPLIAAVQSRNYKCTEYLLQQSHNLNHQDKHGLTALMMAIKLRCTEQFLLLLKAGPDLEIRDSKGYTALMIALYLQNQLMTEALLDSGSCINVVAYDRMTPFSLAMINPVCKVTEQLLELGADVSMSEDYKYLNESILKGDNNIVQKMIMNGCPPLCSYEKLYDQEDGITVTPIVIALLCPRIDTFLFLLSNLYMTPYDVRLLQNHEEFQMLVDAEKDRRRYSFIRPQTKSCIGNVVNHLTKTPFSLFALSFVAVSSCLKPQNTYRPQAVHRASFSAQLFMHKNKIRYQSRPKLESEPDLSRTPRPLSHKEKVKCLPLPDSLKRALSFQTPHASIPPEQWHQISVCLKSKILQ